MSVIFVLVGCGVGLLVGALPSIGASTMLILLFPFLSSADHLSLLMFYAAMITAAQFSGSVVALWLGISGEITSMPILQERVSVIVRGQLFLALRRTALGSAFAAILSVLGVILLLKHSAPISAMLRTETLAALLIAVSVVSLFWAGNKFWINLLMAIGGVFISLIGYHSISDFDFLTFGQPWLYAGLPILPALVGLYGMPKLCEAFRDTKGITESGGQHQRESSAREPLGLFLLTRNTIVGFVVGLIPMVGTVISSSLAYSIEQKLPNSTPLSRITASETANNAASVSVLLPLLLFGVAIQPSEAIILMVLQNTGWTASSLTMSDIVSLMVGVVVASGVCYHICIRYVATIAMIITRYRIVVFGALAVALVYSIWYIGSGMAMSLPFLTVFFVSSVVGFVLQSHAINPLPLIFMWLVGDNTVDVFSRLFQLYS